MKRFIKADLFYSWDLENGALKGTNKSDCKGDLWHILRIL